MIYFGAICVVISILLAVLSWRGFIIKRGQFCRKCKFDLAGSSMYEDERCPECGSTIHLQRNRRSSLRNRWIPGLVTAAVFLLLGSGLIGLSSGANTKAVIARLPNPIVLWLTSLGVDEGLDELVVRTSAIPNTLSNKEWDRAIELGLDFQSDTSLKWDMRWGQVLFDSVMHDKMSDPQLARYVTAGIQFDLQVRANVYPYTVQIPNQLLRSQKRMEPISGGRTGLILLDQLTSYGIVGQPPERTQMMRERNYYLDIFNDGPKSMGSIGMDRPLGLKPDDQVELYFEYQVRLKRTEGSEPLIDETVRKEFTITIVEPETPLIEVVENAVLAQALVGSMHIWPLVVTEEFNDGSQGKPLASASTVMINDPPAFPFAHRIFLVFDDFETQAGRLVHGSYDNSGIGGLILLSPNRSHGLTPEDAEILHAKLLESDTVTVELRTDPTLLLYEPLVSETLGVNITFKDVPIRVVSQYDQYTGYEMNDSIKPSGFTVIDSVP